MKKLNFVISLTTKDNDYQNQQASSATEAARRLGVDVQILYAENDSIVQSQQLLKIIQSHSDSHPEGIIFEPVGGTALPQVARAAAAAGISWVVMNREVEYIDELRKSYRLPIFSLSSNHEEVGRIQGRQMAALLPQGGSVLYIQGPSESMASKNRTLGMEQTRPANIQVKIMKGQWTEASAHKTVSSWLTLSTARQAQIDAIICQNDVMAAGARKAFQEISNSTEREHWLSLPYTGCDGVPETGQSWVRNGLLTATVVIPPIAGQALEMLVRAIQTGVMPPERTFTVPHSYPELEKLARGNGRSRSFSAHV
jgi:ABC-type sugar transport system substrate-binding protein